MPRLAHVLIATALGVSRVQAVNLLASHYTGKIYTLSLAVPGDGGNGTLAMRSSVDSGSRMPAWLELDAASGTVYCFDEMWGGRGVMSSFSVGSNGALTPAGQAATIGGAVHGGLFGGEDGKGFVSVAEYEPSSVSVYKLPLSSSSQVAQTEKFTMTSPGKYLLAPDLGADLIRILAIDTATGKLTACDAAEAGRGDGPRHGAFWTPQSVSTTGTMLYTVNELGNSVTTWTVTYPDAEGGCLSLTKAQTLSTFGEGKTPPARSKAAEVRVAGNFVYASNRNDQTFGAQRDSIVTYAIDASSGAIKFVEAVDAHAWYVRTFQINKAGDLVAVGGQTSSNVAVLSRDAETGRLGGLVASLQVATPGTDGNEDGLSAVIWDE